MSISIQIRFVYPIDVANEVNLGYIMVATIKIHKI